MCTVGCMAHTSCVSGLYKALCRTEVCLESEVLYSENCCNISEALCRELKVTELFIYPPKKYWLYLF